MAKIVKRPVIKRGNVTTVYKNAGDTILYANIEGNPDLKRSVKSLKQRTVKRSPKKIGNLGPSSFIEEEVYRASSQ